MTYIGPDLSGLDAPDGVTPGRWWTHLTRLDGRLLSGNYPFVAEPVDPFEVESLEFLEPDHPVYALRPADPLEIVWGFYSPRASFAYPGGESVLD
ncbi:hypothetical protein [Micromonospora saelicesensis]|uniref:hypothetical protein n=1 Tax=Micromonospora saelicesensis TaxID=285676 RepID=UPI000DC43887|nr:hypothetical protein [Micromonospora saelicesensis]RAO56834.1 hypothetical protein PSN01_03255 [Micromonospora saelicesensis]